MIVSLFSLFVARGAELPVIDPRLIAQQSDLVVDTQDPGSAAQTDVSPGVDATAAQSSSNPPAV